MTIILICDPSNHMRSRTEITGSGGEKNNLLWCAPTLGNGTIQQAISVFYEPDRASHRAGILTLAASTWGPLGRSHKFCFNGCKVRAGQRVFGNSPVMLMCHPSEEPLPSRGMLSLPLWFSSGGNWASHGKEKTQEGRLVETCLQAPMLSEEDKPLRKEAEIKEI